MSAYWKPKTIEVEEFQCKVKIQLWDTAGQERFQSLTKQYTQGASAVILVYDITELDSLSEVMDWFKTVDTQEDTSQMVIALVGNKSDDLERAAVSRKDSQQMAAQVRAKIQMEVSAKTGEKVDKLFMDVAKELCKIDQSVSHHHLFTGCLLSDEEVSTGSEVYNSTNYIILNDLRLFA